MCQRMLTKTGQAINMHGHNVSLVVCCFFFFSFFGWWKKHETPSCGVVWREEGLGEVNENSCYCEFVCNLYVPRSLWQIWAGHHEIHENTMFRMGCWCFSRTYSSKYRKFSLCFPCARTWIFGSYSKERVIVKGRPGGKKLLSVHPLKEVYRIFQFLRYMDHDFPWISLTWCSCQFSHQAVETPHRGNLLRYIWKLAICSTFPSFGGTLFRAPLEEIWSSTGGVSNIPTRSRFLLGAKNCMNTCTKHINDAHGYLLKFIE